MTSKEWIEKAQKHREVLRSLVDNYHPSALKPHKDTDPIGLDITAPDAEMACEVVRQRVREDYINKVGSAVEHFDQAMDAGNVAEVGTILNQTWFGVPESTSCWQITGFKEAVDLLEDPPDDMEVPA